MNDPRKKIVFDGRIFSVTISYNKYQCARNKTRAPSLVKKNMPKNSDAILLTMTHYNLP